MNAGDSFINFNTVENVVNLLDDKALIIYGDTLFNYFSYTNIKKALNLNQMKYGMIFCHQSSFVKTKYHKDNKFSLKYKISGDYNFFLSLYIKNKNAFKYAPLTISKFAFDGISNSSPFKIISEKIKILKILKIYTLDVRVYIYIALVKMIIKIILPEMLVKKINTKNRK